jgi:hypothetical protein
VSGAEWLRGPVNLDDVGVYQTETEQQRQIDDVYRGAEIPATARSRLFVSNMGAVCFERVQDSGLDGPKQT